jgi:hypothetical protein
VPHGFIPLRSEVSA